MKPLPARLLVPGLSLLLMLAQPAAGDSDGNTAAARVRALLADLVAAAPINPPGHETRAVAVVGRRLEGAGIPYEVSEFAPGRSNLVARLDGDGEEAPLLLLAHSDVVGAAGQPWTIDPHELTERDGYLYGRGVFDDLGMAALAVEVMVMLRETKTPLRRDVILAFTGDEESGGRGIRHLLEHRPASIAAALALNEGGRIVIDETGEPKLVELQVAEKIYRDFELAAEGPTGHSSVPLDDNSIQRIGRALDRIGSHRFPVRLLPVTRAWLAARAAVEEEPVSGAMRALAESSGAPPEEALRVLLADPVHAATLRTTCVPTLVEGGTRENALPARATANVNCRILPDESEESTRETLVRLIDDPSVTVKPVGLSATGPPSPLDGPGPAAIRRVLEELFPGILIVPGLSRGATDSRYLRAAGIPAYGLHPLPMSEADARRAHGVDERIGVEALATGFDVLHRLVLELAAR